jgi:ribA/ribD-fused uncharacterized protein
MINKFDGKYRWLSNFANVNVLFDGVTYPSVENAYQAAKTTNLIQRKFFETCSAVAAKRAGKLLDIRPDWESIKVKIMQLLNQQKYNQEPYREALLQTGDQTIKEGNYWGDTFWGVCNGVGKNTLGRLIMDIRDDLKR